MTGLLLSRRCVLGAPSCLIPLTGCTLLFPPSAPQLYRLTPRIDDAPYEPYVHKQLVIAVPVAPQSLDTDRIALSRNPPTLDYFAGAVWTDRAPVLLQGLLVEAFENGDRIVGVGRDSSGLNADYLLETELRKFEAHYTGTSTQLPTVAVSMVAKLVKMSDRQVIGRRITAEQATAARNDLDSIVDAFDVAVGRILSKIVDWTLRLMAPAR
jgi:cholesterol transport system auxiliary component